jgi:hypothetical protein
MDYHFKPGDLVTKLYGKKIAKVLYECSWNHSQLYCEYLHSKVKFTEYKNNLKPYNPEESEPAMETKTLYSFQKPNGTLGYGTHIGTNSANEFLIEEKGTNTIHVFKKSQIEEVLPYTFSAVMNGKETHYVCEPDSVKKGDVLLYTGSTNNNSINLAVVTAVDTKNKTARSKFRGVKLVTAPI